MPSTLTITLVDATTGAALPQICHMGKNYVMSTPGSEYRVTASLDCPGETNHLKFKLMIDGRKVSHTKNRSPNANITVAWDGFPVGVGLTNFKRFKFADAEIDDGAGGASGSGAVSAEAGVIQVECWRVKKTGRKTKPSSQKFAALPKDSLLAKKKKGGKFFNNPSLTTSSGGAVNRHHKMSKNVYRKFESLPLISTKLHTETLETLRLRKVPVPAAMVAAYFSAPKPVVVIGAVQVKADSSSSSSSSDNISGSRRQKRKARAAAAAAAAAKKPKTAMAPFATGVIDLTT